MGFWGDLWSGIKSVAGQVYDTVRKPVDWIAGAGDTLKKIPFIGGALSTALSPVTGLARTIQGGLDTARGVADVGKALGLKEGGIVPGLGGMAMSNLQRVLNAVPKKVYQA